MGIERELARDLLAKVRSRGATEADLLIVETDSSTTQVRLREVESLKSAQERRIHLRVMFGHRSAADRLMHRSRNKAAFRNQVSSVLRCAAVTPASSRMYSAALPPVR